MISWKSVFPDLLQREVRLTMKHRCESLKPRNKVLQGPIPKWETHFDDPARNSR